MLRNTSRLRSTTVALAAVALAASAAPALADPGGGGRRHAVPIAADAPDRVPSTLSAPIAAPTGDRTAVRPAPSAPAVPVAADAVDRAPAAPAAAGSSTLLLAALAGATALGGVLLAAAGLVFARRTRRQVQTGRVSPTSPTSR